VSSDWRQKNLTEISERLRPVLEAPVGILYTISSSHHEIAVYKDTRSHIILKFIDPTADEIMSRMDIKNPLYLLAPYTQAMLLGLVWRPEPWKVYIIGLGAGRIPMILHHYHSDVIIDSTEIDSEVLPVAKRFFALKPDKRLHVEVQDGRDYLARRRKDMRYDIIFSDAFRGTGYGPYQFATREFYNLCNEHLAGDGVLVVNLLPRDSLYKAKIRTMTESFTHVYRVSVKGSDIFFCLKGNSMSLAEVSDRAKSLQIRHGFTFPFAQHAARVSLVSEMPAYSDFMRNVPILSDSNAPPEYFDSLSGKSTIFKRVGRNDPCPCGSGKKFKKCHARFQP
jgi:spermidine synthase